MSSSDGPPRPHDTVAPLPPVPSGPVPTDQTWDAETLAREPAPAGAATIDRRSAGPAPVTPFERGTPASDYDVGDDLLGKGGMGEVLLAHDRKFDRDVALKRMREPAPDASQLAVARFLREARVQARLEHPAIVPVYDLGTDADGRPFFTMKRLVGTTLHDLIETAEPQQRLLRAFADVCLAIEFAHTRGVVHRDLKPANIMLGDFGEVYVLDWGIARVLDDGPHAVPGGDIPTAPGHTQAGAVVGTPGYMAPEQVEGLPVGPPADVYALGAVLFELLTGEPLHPRNAAMASTLARPTEAPSARAPTLAIPPELDAACVAALADDAAARPTARALGERIQRYLDGDRDHERRRQLAAEFVAASIAARDSGDPGRRAEAVRAAGRALALDPESRTAADLVTAFVVEPPAVNPPELAASLAATEQQASRVRSKKAVVAYLSGVAFVALIPWIDVRSWPLLIAFFGVLIGMAVLSWRSYRRARILVPVAMLANLIAIAMFSRLIGPFILTPIFTSGILLGVVMIPWVHARRAWAVGYAIVASLTPILLELTGVFARSWTIDDTGLVTTSQILRGVHGWLEPVALIAMNTFYITILALFALAVGRDQHQAQRDLHVQAWHLQQLLPRKIEPR